MSSLEYELRFINAGIEQLESYLLSTQLYWPIGISPPSGYPPYPPLTIGNLLLADRKAQALARENAHRNNLQKSENELKTIASQWGLKWENKCVREFQARLTLWGNYLQEYRENPGNNYDRYNYEVSRRVILELLLTAHGAITQSNLELLTTLDAVLYELLNKGEFIWENDLAVLFPRADFWFLYGNLPT